MTFSLTTSVTTLWLIALWTISSAECQHRRRVRKAWHSLSDAEQMLYVVGFQNLTRQGVLKEFIDAHQHATGHQAEYNIHKSSQNLFWHSYWIYELENAFRSLGGELECFTLPFWDVTKDGEYWLNAEDPQIDDIPIYDGNLGGEGDAENDYCVEGLWSKKHFVTEELCADDELSKHCCLKRQHAEIDDLNRSTVIYEREHVAEIVFTNSIYQPFVKFLGAIGGFHGDIHSFFGSLAGTHFCGDGNGAPTWEPLFPLFHTFIDFLRLLHEDCNEFDTVSADDLESLGTAAYDPSYKGADCPLDYVMDFDALCDERDALCGDEDITPRLMFDVSPNTQFHIVYELGDFWSENSELVAMCTDSLNATWWELPAVVAEEDAVAGRILLAEHSGATVVVMAFMLIGVAVVALLRRCAATTEKRPLFADRDGNAYGTV